jgi:hypothetical protein
LFDPPREVAPWSRRDPPLNRAAVVPELPGSLGWIDAGILPPGGFIAYAVHQPMMNSTERHRELVARLALLDLHD